MEFWGIEIKPGKPFNVKQEDGYLIHLSQVTLGELNKVGDETVQIYVKAGGDDKPKLLLGNLSQKIPQISLDVAFEQDFEISHGCKSSSIYILGYKIPDPMDDELNSDFDSEDEEIPMDRFQSELEKSNANGLNDQKANVEAGESESEAEDESDSDEIGSDDDEDDSEEEDDAPVKVESPSKKRPNGASKKANVASQQKPSGRHKGHKCGGVHPPKRN